MKEELVLQVKIKEGQQPQKLDLNVDLDINRENINAEMTNQPSMFAWYAVLHELAKAKSVEMKRKEKAFRAELDKKIRSKAKEDEVKLTETAIDSIITTSPDFINIQKLCNNADLEAGLLNVARQAFEQRKDMLISISSNMRNEVDTDIKVLKESVRKKMSKLKGSET